ncbi:MAG: hypothetical protein EBQ92_06290, partial [Proteobacteria bacterium]|nr:hypothetical protein [Pseudomonadota bacterium]
SLEIGTQRQGPDNILMSLEYANGVDGFKIWKENYGTRILNSTGLVENGWQKQLTRAGTAFSETDFTTGSNIAGRVCPGLTAGSGVFVDFNNMVDSTRCLYYDSGNASQTLDAAATSGTEASDWLQAWNSAATGRGTGHSYYEGNIKTCADKGMRLPTLYETSATTNPLQPSYPTDDGLDPTHPNFAGSTNGVPSFGNWAWTASALTYTSGGYWGWSGTDGFQDYYSSYLSVRCVLPSHGVTEDPPPPPPDPPVGTDCTPTLEVCDGVDNDCNELVDENTDENGCLCGETTDACGVCGGNGTGCTELGGSSEEYCVARTEEYQTSWYENRTGVDPCLELCGEAIGGDGYCGCWEECPAGLIGGCAWHVSVGACSPPQGCWGYVGNCLGSSGNILAADVTADYCPSGTSSFNFTQGERKIYGIDSTQACYDYASQYGPYFAPNFE